MYMAQLKIMSLWKLLKTFSKWIKIRNLIRNKENYGRYKDI